MGRLHPRPGRNAGAPRRPRPRLSRRGRELRAAIAELDDLDLVTQDMFIGQTEQLELFHWFIRAHLEDQGGRLSTEGANDEQDAALAAGRA